MPIVDKSIVEPEMPRPGIPLKKSTLGILAALVLGAGFLSSVLFSGSGTAPSNTTATTDAAPQVGNERVIEEEERKAVEAVAVAPVAVVPPAVQRTDQTAALYENAPARTPQPSDAEVEQEAQVRNARALVHDFSAEGAAQATGQSLGGSDTAGPRLPPFDPTIPSAPRRDEITNPRMQDALDLLARGQSPAASSRKFLDDYAKQSGGGSTLVSYRNKAPFILHQGKIIPAVLGRRVNSDLPGELTATVNVDVYDSLGKGHLLIPKGSMLVGRYDSDVKVGQRRLLFAFSRLILPNGDSFDLPAAQGTDLAGASGVQGDVNNHFFRMFASSLLISVLADRTQQPAQVTVIGGGGGGGSVNAAGQVLTDVSKSILERNRTIQPTLTIDQGTRLNVEVVQDMVFVGPYPGRR